jgi:hypothetical protein
LSMRHRSVPAQGAQELGERRRPRAGRPAPRC